MTMSPKMPLVGVALCGLAVSIRILGWPLARITVPASATPSAARTPSSRAVVDSESTSAIVSRDVFRITHRPVLPPYDPLRLAEQQAPQPPRPALVLVGIVEGAAPSAVIEGLPGIEGSRVLRAGDAVGALQVRKIGNGRVVITGLDTTWVLEVREPWKQ